MAGSPDRRSEFSQAVMVEKGIWLATHEGIGAAIAYLDDQGIAERVAFRVLSGPKFQRNSGERRKWPRH